MVGGDTFCLLILITVYITIYSNQKCPLASIERCRHKAADCRKSLAVAGLTWAEARAWGRYSYDVRKNLSSRTPPPHCHHVLTIYNEKFTQPPLLQIAFTPESVDVI